MVGVLGVRRRSRLHPDAVPTVLKKPHGMALARVRILTRRWITTCLAARGCNARVSQESSPALRRRRNTGFGCFTPTEGRIDPLRRRWKFPGLKPEFPFNGLRRVQDVIARR